MEDHSIYPYDPNKDLPILFAVIVSILAILLFYQSFRFKWTHFNLMVTWASVVWIAGFITRTLSAFTPSSVGLYFAQYVLIFVGPPLYAASEYFILGRVLSTFLILSAVVEAFAASGAASLANQKPSSDSSAFIRIKVSLILQEVVEACFFGLVALVEFRCRRAGHFPRNVRIMCRMLYVTSLMMLIRCIVRTIEGFEATACDPLAPGYKGYCGPVQHYEWFLWVFEVANITVFVALLAIFHPGRYLPSDPKRYLDPVVGTTERIGSGYSAADKRPWLITVMDPFDI